MGKKYILEGTVELEDDGMTGRVFGVLRSALEPSKVLGLVATEVTNALVTLEWLSIGDVTSWIVYRDDALLVEVTAPTYTDASVDPDTEYSYSVEALNGEAVGERSDPLIVTTAVPAVPDVPTGLIVTRITFNEVDLVWDAMEGATGYEVHRDGGLLATITASNYTDATVADSTTYEYQVLASNSSGSSALCDAIEVITELNDPPIWDVIPNQTGTVGQSISIDFRTMCEDPEAQSLTFTIANAPPGVSMSTDGFLLVGVYASAGSYSAIVTANDGDNTVDAPMSFVISATLDTTAPTVPTNVLAVANGSTVTVTWDASTDTQSGVRRYRILRDGLFLAMDSGSPFINSDVPNGTYSYTVRAEDNANTPANGNISGLSNASVVVVNVGTGAPDTPTSFVAFPNGILQLDLSWVAGTSGATPTDYDVDFSTVGASGPWTELPVVGTDTTFQHNVLSAVQHWYRLRANAGASSSAYTTTTATPNGGFGQADFIIAAGDDEFDCSLATPVTGAARKVLPGEIVQINSKDGNLTGTILTIKNPEAPASNPIRFRPPANARCNFKRGNAGGGFLVQISGSMTNPNVHGGVMFDGETTSTNVPLDPDTGLRYGFRIQPFSAADDPTGWLDVHGFVKNVTVRYVHWDCAGHGGTGWAPNTNTLERPDFPGVFKGPFTMQWSKFEGTGGVYIGSNYSKKFPDATPGNPMGLPCKDVTVEYCYWTGTTQTPILIKNCWEGFCEVHHNIIKTCSIQNAGAVQKRSIATNGCVGEIHHNWVENTANNISGGAQSPNNAIVCGTNKGPSNTGDPGYNLNGAGVPQPYPFILMKVYSNIVFKGPEMGLNSQNDAGTVKTRIQVFNNTFDNFRDWGINIGNTNDDQSFARNNVVTRCRASGSQVNGPFVEGAKNFLSGNRGDADGTLSGIYADVAAKDYRLVAARAVHGTSVLFNGTNNGDVAPTDFASAYVGDFPDESDDVTRTTVAGADMGAFEKA